jgi:hypothetical protein
MANNNTRDRRQAKPQRQVRDSATSSELLDDRFEAESGVMGAWQDVAFRWADPLAYSKTAMHSNNDIAVGLRALGVGQITE